MSIALGPTGVWAVDFGQSNSPVGDEAFRMFTTGQRACTLNPAQTRRKQLRAQIGGPYFGTMKQGLSVGFSLCSSLRPRISKK